MNLFERANYLDGEPRTVTAGQSWLWKRTDLGTSYPPALYTVKYRLVGHALEAYAFELSTVEDGAVYYVEQAPSATEARIPGVMSWTLNVTRDADSASVDVDQGRIEILPNPLTDARDPRAFAERQVAHLKDVVDRLNQRTHAATTSDVSVTLVAKAEARRELVWWQNRVDELRRRERLRDGKKAGRELRVRFG